MSEGTVFRCCCRVCPRSVCVCASVFVCVCVFRSSRLSVDGCTCPCVECVPVCLTVSVGVCVRTCVSEFARVCVNVY